MRWGGNMNLWYIAKANLSRKKGTSVSLFILMMLVTLLCISSLSVLTNIDTMFIKKTEELNSPHYFVAVNKNLYKDSYGDYFEINNRVQVSEKEDIVYMTNAIIDFGGNVQVNVMGFNADAYRQIAPMKLVESLNSVPKEKAIFIPYYAKNLGYQLGDTYQIHYNRKDYSFIVAGYYESAEFNQSMAPVIKHFFSQEAFAHLYEEIGGSVGISVRVKDKEELGAMIESFKKEVDFDISGFEKGTMVADLSMNSIAATLSIKMIFALFIAFSLFAIIIILMMIRFRVSTSIEDEMHNIGALGALGFTSREIIVSILIEYSVVAFTGSIAGMICTFGLLPVISSLMTSVSGILWGIGADLYITAITIIVLLVLTMLVCLLSSRKINKLPPVKALRGGTENHNFKRNHIPLSKGIGNVHIRLGFKNILSNIKLYMMVGLILSGITFVMLILNVTYDNFVNDRTAFIKMTGAELSDVTITFTKHGNQEELLKQLESMDEVRKTSMTDMVPIKIGGIDMFGTVSDDYTVMESLSVYEGTMPVFPNEIVTTKVVSEQLNKYIGDTVTVKAKGVEKEYIITGFTQTTMNGGTLGLLTLEGYQNLVPEYQRNTMNVYLKEGADINRFIEKLESTFGVVNKKKEENPEADDKYAGVKARAEEKISNYLSQYGVDSLEYSVILNGEIILSGSSSAYQIEEIINLGETLEAKLGSFITSISLLVHIIALVSLSIITLILFLVIRSIIARRRTEFGILKANGYATSELMFQLALSFVPVALCGVALGTILGGILVNPILTLLFSVLGVSHFVFTINPLLIVLTAAIITVSTFIIAMAATYRIKSISVRDLLTD